MKRLAAALLKVSTLFLAIPFSAAEAEEPEAFTGRDWEYRVRDDGTAVITGYQGSGSKVNVPGRLGGKTVTGIGEKALFGCQSMVSATIPDSVTGIGDEAFSGCKALTSVTIPDSVTRIEEYAFAGCSSLTAVTIPDSVTSIGEDTFSDCGRLTAAVSRDSYAKRYCEENGIRYLCHGIENSGKTRKNPQ